jgi:DNA-binding MarR family transcriptional regulator
LIGEVARNLGVGLPGISGLVDRMEGAGLVRRVPDAADGRSVRLVLTEQGRSAREVSKRLVASINARLVKSFSDSELDVVARWLTHVSEKFKRDLEG